MNGKRAKTSFLSFPLLILVILFFPLGNVWTADYFVKPDGTGGDCTRSSPCLFTTALTNAVSGDYIVFKEGEYIRDFPDPPYPVIVLGLGKGISLMGGWDGSASGTLVIEPDRHPSILNGEDVRPVIKILGPISATIAGFTIRNGNANNSPSICGGVNPNKGCGGGIYVYQAEALIANNKFLDNQANDGRGWGGGIHLENASGTIVKKNNLFQGNQAKGGGGLSLYGSASTSPTIENNNRFIQNSALSGGAILFEGQSNPTIQDNVFENNSASFLGIGIFGTGPGSAVIKRNLFQNHTGNVLVVLGGFQGNFEANRLLNNNVNSGLYLEGGGPATIARNFFQNHTGNNLVTFFEFSGSFEANQLLNNNVNSGLTIVDGSPIISNNFIARSGLAYGLALSLDTAVIEHNTLVGENIGKAIEVSSLAPLGLNNNIISGYPLGIDATGSPGIVTARHTLFDDSVTTSGNNVNFVNSLVGAPGFKDPAANDFHIQLASAARDAGSANFTTTTRDIDGDPRPIGSAPDIGADEFDPSLLKLMYLPLINR